MEKFELEKYLANPSRKVVTRNGCPVRIICTDAKLGSTKIVGLVMGDDGTECITTWTKEGKLLFKTGILDDLFFAPEKHEGWINIYEDMGNRKYTGIYDTKAEAEDSVSPEGCYLTTIKIEWEE